MEFNNYMVLFMNEYNSYSREEGLKKVRKIENTINNSKHTHSFMYQCRSKKIIPSAKDLASCVLSNLSLSFSGSKKVKFASLILLDKWHAEVNEDLLLAPDNVLVQLIKEINIQIN